ncbi:MAG: hypothetical protein J07HX64_01037 [halophilic archaeon J07HX64]|jgi:hypothetical protein|nr:MAG: hypothetical protein J07HX64_01037 [halophilic archaeon J07HX64]
MLTVEHRGYNGDIYPDTEGWCPATGRIETAVELCHPGSFTSDLGNPTGLSSNSQAGSVGTSRNSWVRR